MKTFYDNKVLLSTEIAMNLYNEVKDLPIIDYHCHLNHVNIANDIKFSDIGELWLANDHYKWRAMRMCGVDEYFITGKASFHDKFIKYAEILPYLVGNPLYYWTHMELKIIFDINKPLNSETAEEIYRLANEKLKDISVVKLLKTFNVEYIATTDDPLDNLNLHGDYAGIKVRPTFRPDKLFLLEDDYIKQLEALSDIKIMCLDDLLKVLEKRLDYFVDKGCKISDHGFERFPKKYANKEEASKLFLNRLNLSSEEKDSLFGFLLVWLTKEYKKRDMIMQLHFSVIRNNNKEMSKICGADSGFDLIGHQQDVKDLVLYLNQVSEKERPKTILYSLNTANLEELCAVTGAFKNVKMGAAWWFNDTLKGIKRNLEVIAEYSVLGTSYGMLTDSRSFSSYVRFDFFRRILADYLGTLVEYGEYDFAAAKKIIKNICYQNIKEILL